MAQEGVVFPSAPGGNNRPTTQINCATFTAALAANDKAASVSASGDEKKWRRAYARHVVRHVELAAASPEAAVASAQAGLDHIYSALRFIRNGAESSIAAAMETHGAAVTVA
jgi:hypothetical protein